LSYAPFTRMFGWKLQEHVKPLLENVLAEIRRSKYHAYHNIHIITARRPL